MDLKAATTPLILFSGMGADERVFAAQRAEFPNLLVPAWIDPRPRESLAEYARRLAARIDPKCPCVIGGASFGGMAAIEVARHLNARACVLIGSVRSPEQFPMALRAARGGAGAAAFAPFELACWLAWVHVPMFGWCSSPATRAFLRQAADADARFLRWAAWAVFTWRPVPLDLPVFHIHGGRDRILPCRHVRPDQIIADAGHVLSVSHPRELNDFLRQAIARAP